MSRHRQPWMQALVPMVGACLLAMLLAASGLAIVPRSAWGVTEQTEAKITEAQQRIEESAAAYEEAQERIAELEQQAADNEQRIAELEEALPAQQKRSDEAVTVLYKMNREGHSLINMVLASESITDFLVRIDYLMRYQERNLDAIRELSAMQDELEATRASLDAALAEAEGQEAVAKAALEEAQEAREEAQRQAQEEAQREREAQEAARKAAEEAAAKAAQEAARQEGPDDGDSDDAAQEPEEIPSTSPSDDGANWSGDKAAFVDQWAPRINRYLAGSPLAGTGETFAAAAWDYGVDPRWSPAISAVESSKGAACFRPHNAWGWGSASWGSWEEAINAHVSGLARGYGYTLSESAAKKYCPSSWQHWYDRCAEEMNSI